MGSRRASARLLAEAGPSSAGSPFATNAPTAASTTTYSEISTAPTTSHSQSSKRQQQHAGHPAGSPGAQSGSSRRRSSSHQAPNPTLNAHNDSVMVGQDDDEALEEDVPDEEALGQPGRSNRNSAERTGSPQWEIYKPTGQAGTGLQDGDEPAEEELDEEDFVGEEILDALGEEMAIAGEDDEEEEEEEEEDDEEEEYESSSQSGTDSLTWISWYCSLPGHEYFAEVTEDFIEDDFNLTGLSQLVPFYKEALEMVLDVEPEEEALKIPDMSIVESSAELLYGLIHQRYILTRQGLAQMVTKYENAHFGYCPRVFCNQTRVLPSGRSDLPGVDGVKLFCPNCLDTYTPPSSRFNGVDGAFFGTTFPHLLFQQHPELVPPLNNGLVTQTTSTAPPSSAPTSPAPDQRSRQNSTVDTSKSTGGAAVIDDSAMADISGDGEVPWSTSVTSAAKIYIPRIYGFKVSERARSGPRMQWLRLRPQDPRELERINNKGHWKAGVVAAVTVVAKATPAVSPVAVATVPAVAPARTLSNTGGAANPVLAAAAPLPASNTSKDVRQSRSRQKLGLNASTGGGSVGTSNNNDDTLPPRKAQSNARGHSPGPTAATSAPARRQ